MAEPGDEQAGKVAVAVHTAGKQRVSFCVHSLLFPAAAFLMEGHAEPGLKVNESHLNIPESGSESICPDHFFSFFNRGEGFQSSLRKRLEASESTSWAAPHCL